MMLIGNRNDLLSHGTSFEKYDIEMLVDTLQGINISPW